MNPTWAEVNAAVLAVLAGWNRAAGRGRSPMCDGQARPEVFADRLLGVRRAAGLLDRAEVRVLPGTVITPLARDLLRRQGVAVRVASGRDAAAARAQDLGEWGFAIEGTRQTGLAEALRQHWLDDGWVAIEGEAPAWVAEAEGRGAVILADEAAPAAWRANRVEGIRAASVGDVDEAARAIRHLGANVLVVEPIARPVHLIRQIARHFRAAGAPVAPAWHDDEGDDR